MSRVPSIFLNDNIISHATQCGIARYFRHVTDGVIADFGSDVIICSPEARDYHPARHIPSPRFRGSRRIGLHDKLVTIAAYLERPSVCFSPYYGNARTKSAEVFTVHDMIYEIFPQHFPREDTHIRQFILEKRLCLERAATLIAISESTARDIVRCYPHIDASKIVKIYYGVDDFFFADNEEHDTSSNVTQKPYLLYVGNRALYKNFLRFLIAYGRSGIAKEFDLCVISPRSSLASQEVDSIERYHLQESVRFVISPPQPALRASYAKAAALVYPSEYEGFGLPVLEGMASGTLVATSNTSSLPEVGGDVALYFDPYSSESIADCITRVVNLSSTERSERIARGIAHARTFTWETCQRQTVDLLKRLA